MWQPMILHGGDLGENVKGEWDSILMLYIPYGCALEPLHMNFPFYRDTWSARQW